MPPAPHAPPPPGNGITMLGATGTGKTTFLAALQIALLKEKEFGWSLASDNPGSTRAMVRFMDKMTRQHEFPSPTDQKLENYLWSLSGETRMVWEWRRGLPRRRVRTVSIPLDLIDAPGEIMDGTRIFDRKISMSFVSKMASSAGIIFFFDPLRESERGDAFQHMYGVLAELRRQVPGEGRLPHYMAVCITKFDAIPVFRSTQALELITYESSEPYLPTIPEEDAQEFFVWLTKRSRSDDASMIMPLLERSFHAERLRFFVTSAIGFYVDSTVGLFDPDNYQNVIPGKPDRIRGGIYPVNVVEPMLWLGENAARTAG